MIYFIVNFHSLERTRAVNAFTRVRKPHILFSHLKTILHPISQIYTSARLPRLHLPSLMTTTDVILRNLFFHCPAAVFSKDSEQLFLYLPRGFSEFICLIMIRAWILIRAISKLWGFRAQTRAFRNVNGPHSLCF